MSKYIAVIPRAAITRAALVEAGGRSMEQVKAACGCQYILNAWFYDTITGRPVGNLSHPSRGAWIEITHMPPSLRGAKSHPSRGAWIEISK